MKIIMYNEMKKYDLDPSGLHKRRELIKSITEM